MMRIIITTIFIAGSFFTSAQTEVAVATGNWHNIFTWQGLVSTPTAGEDVIIGSAYTVSLSLNGACDTLYLAGGLNINSGSELDLDAIEMDTTAVITVSSGTVTLDADLDYDGSLNITPNSSNFIEVSGDIRHGGQTKVITNDGTLRIYSELEF